MITLIRGIIQKFTSTPGKSQKFNATGRPDESFTDRTAFSQYGFASSLPEGAEAILLKTGQNVFLIASDDRRYRIALEEGEVGIYSMFGDNIVLKKDNTIEVNANRVVVNASLRAIVNAPSVELGDETIDPTDGCVTGKCACAAYGVPHPVVSAKVKATMA